MSHAAIAALVEATIVKDPLGMAQCHDPAAITLDAKSDPAAEAAAKIEHMDTFPQTPGIDSPYRLHHPDRRQLVGLKWLSQQ